MLALSECAEHLLRDRGSRASVGDAHDGVVPSASVLALGERDLDLASACRANADTVDPNHPVEREARPAEEAGAYERAVRGREADIADLGSSHAITRLRARLRAPRP